MAAIDEVGITGLLSKQEVTAKLWDWLDDRRFDIVWSIRILWWQKQITWQDLFPQIEKLIGQRA
jgi:hypothetical protein